MQIDGRVIRVGDLDDIIAHAKFTNFLPKFPVVHNTSVPDIELFNQWIARGKPSFEDWLKNLAAFYSGKGWYGGPHFFVGPDGRIGLLTPLTMRGVHSPSWNGFSIGIETVGEFERETFAGSSSEYALTALLGALCWHLGWKPDDYRFGISGIHFHKEDPKTDHRTCPGHFVVKSKLIADVCAYIANTYEGGHEHGPSIPAAQAETADLPAAATGPRAMFWVQDRLNLWFKLRPFPGWVPLNVDGSIGPKTKNAVELFQSAMKLNDVDGVPGILTRKKLATFQ